VLPDEANIILKNQLKDTFRKFAASKDIKISFEKLLNGVRAPLTDTFINSSIQTIKEQVKLKERKDLTENSLKPLKRQLEDLQIINEHTNDMNQILKYNYHLKIIIPANKKKYFIKQLEDLGINSSTVYPDLDGMIKYLNEKYK
jgi:hypothetical protein